MDELINQSAQLSTEQLAELILTVKNLYAFDLDLYRKASLTRRIIRIMELYRLSFADIRFKLINEPAFFVKFLEEVTVNVTEMFRDPSFYIALQKHILPYINTYTRFKCWSAGCSTGEEAYSIAIFLEEQKLYRNAFIYGTDLNNEVVKKARTGIYSLGKIKSYAENYRQTGLSGDLLQYFTLSYEAAAIRNELKTNLLFSQHNLLSDQVFNEFQLILCRNVFIYFQTELQQKVVQLFYDSLCPLGFLCLGSREMLPASELRRFKVIDKAEHIYQKIA